MKVNVRRLSNKTKLIILAVIALVCAVAYLFVAVKFDNPKLFHYAMKIRIPKLIVMLITAFAIGYDLYCGGNRHGGSDFLSRIDYCKSFQTAFEDLPAFSAGTGNHAVWHDRSDWRTVYCRTGLRLFCSDQRIYFSGRRSIFPLSAA